MEPIEQQPDIVAPHHHAVAEVVADTSKEAATFTALRYASNILWVGGTALSIMAQRKYGVSAAIACPALAASVATTEYAGSAKAIDLFDSNSENSVSEQPSRTLFTLGKDAIALAYASWSGAMSTVKVNNSLGLESTPRRRMAQSATYGAGVSLWSLPFTQNVAIAAGKNAVENPVEWLASGAVGSLLVYGVVRGVQWARAQRHKHKVTETIVVDEVE